MNKLSLVTTAQDNQLRLEIDIDSVPLKGTINLYDLIRSQLIPASRYYLLTCSCGAPGCAGINDEIVQHIDITANSVYWHFPESSYGTDFNGKSFTFDLNQFKSEIAKFRNEVSDLERRGGRFMELSSDRVGDNGEMYEVTRTFGDIVFYPIDEGEHVISRKILLYNSVSSIREGLKQVKMAQGLKRETYRLEIIDVVNDFYEELSARTNDFLFNPSLYTLAIAYVNDSINEGAFIDDDFFFGADGQFKGKFLKNSVLASFNKMLKRGHGRLKSIVSAQSIKILPVKEEQ